MVVVVFNIGDRIVSDFVKTSSLMYILKYLRKQLVGDVEQFDMLKINMFNIIQRMNLFYDMFDYNDRVMSTQKWFHTLSYILRCYWLQECEDKEISVSNEYINIDGECGTGKYICTELSKIYVINFDEKYKKDLRELVSRALKKDNYVSYESVFKSKMSYNIKIPIIVNNNWSCDYI
jgi:hypothetical protein